MFSLSRALGFVAAAILLCPAAAAALTMEEAQTSCRASVGTPIVRACMGGQRGDGPQLEACRAKASPSVRACVMAAMNKANGRANVAIQLNTRKEAAPIGNALPAGFVPPPRTIADITAILDNEKPDAATLAKLKEDAEEEPETGLSAADLAEFYYDRANARVLLGRYTAALADGQKALSIASGAGEPMLLMRVRQFIGLQKQQVGDVSGSLRDFLALARDTSNVPGLSGFIFNASRNAMQAMIATGDIPQAEATLRRSTAALTEFRTSGIPKKREAYAQRGRNWEGDYNSSRAAILEARGQYREAEAAYKQAEDYKRASIPDAAKLDYSSPPAQMLLSVDTDAMNVARMKARQGRLAEAEVDARRVLLSRLKAQGKYNPATPRFVMGLAGVLIDQGRYADAEKLVRAALDIQRTLGIGDDTQYSAQILSQLGAILNFQRKPQEAAIAYAELDKAIAKWEPARRQVLELNGSRIASLYASGQVQAGLAFAQDLLKREIARVGDKHFDTAAARGIYARGLSLAGRDADAIREFRIALPVLLAASRESADDEEDATVSAARGERLQNIVEAYIAVLAKSNDNAGGDTALETFALADSIRGHSVQKALSASSARSAVKDPALVELVRKEQDLGKQINGQLGALNNALASNARDENVIKATNAAVDKLRVERDRARTEITRRFPDYADLVDPKPPTVAQIKAALAPGEALLSFYFGRQGSFVWAVPKDGAIAFAAISASAADIEQQVYKLREALEPQAAMVSDIPAFDVALGYELYSKLLKPVESGWKSAQNLIVVTNGALGLLPLALLPTEPAQAAATDEPLFDSYKKVAWLARTHAVTTVPSASALRTLRQLPPGKTNRGELIAFGDPYFSKEQAAEAANPVKVADLSATTRGGLSTRGMPLKRRNAPQLEGVDSAELALLPRLPDTADELKSIAMALQADPDKVLNLGLNASEKNVKSADLSGFKVVAFATHGLVPGELNGLTQPALALSAPGVADTDGDGLLTMEEILALKLDADWVVLSACNTGAGSGAGAEAASGLGRAFFYAGTRALLVTNWSVHSQSARELVTDLFKRQADDPKLTRGEALRQAMMALADGKGYVDDDGKTLFSYAHPLFWAPYTIIGDGGRR